MFKQEVFTILLLFGSIYGQEGPGTPVVLWHGMGDSCCNPFSMGHIKHLIEENTPNGTYVYSIAIGDNIIDDTVNGFLKPVNIQVQMACDQIASDPLLQNGFHAMGFSQGSQFLRAVAQRCPDPPMRNLVTLGGQHQGVFGFPGCPGESVELCNLMREALSYGAYNPYVQAHLVQAQYWHDPIMFETYVEASEFIAEINNEKPVKNASYAVNLAQLENFVMIMNTEDVTIEPRETAHFDFYIPGSETEILPLRQSPIYLEDRIGLKTLDEAGKLIFYDIPGDHLAMDEDWFINEIILQYFND